MVIYVLASLLPLLILGAALGSTWCMHILLALDCLGTALIGGFYGETMSSYAYRMDEQGKPGGRVARPAIDWLFAWQEKEGGHCHYAWQQMKLRTNMPPELR